MAIAIDQPMSSIQRHLWGTARIFGVLLTGALLAGLFVQPRESLHILWNMVIPLLPAVFLINPALWRNVCPLATLNALTGNRVGKRELAPQPLRIAWIGGIVLLMLMVPARRLIFNSDGPALSLTIAAVAALALLAGLIFRRRSGFCNALCPVLPVEKLYGQSPILGVANARCETCSGCTVAGCLELAKQKTVAQTLGKRRDGTRWLWTSFGLFAAGFPGFIVGYFTTADTDWTAAGDLYLHMGICVGISLLIVVALVTIGRIPAGIAVPILGAVALGLYYWFATPPVAHAYHLGDGAITPIRAAIGTLLGGWLWVRLRDSRRHTPDRP